MKSLFTRSMLLVLFMFGGINAAFADYWNAGKYNGYFQFTTTKLSLDQRWIGWSFPDYDEHGIDDALRFSHWYVGGDEAAYSTYITDPQKYFYTPLVQGTKVAYMDRRHTINEHANPEYGLCNVQSKKQVGDITTHEVAFYPGEEMGPGKMSNFFVRWTGFWDIDDNEGSGYWIGENSYGNALEWMPWPGPGNKGRGSGVARFIQVTYDIPATKQAQFSRKPGGKIEAVITGNNHNDWNEYYGFGSNDDTDNRGYYINSYGNAELSNANGTYTLDGTFDETEDYIIYYHQYYKRSEIINNHTVNQHFQAPLTQTVVKGCMYPSNLMVTQNKWDKSVRLTWETNQKDKDHNTDGGWLVFRQKAGETDIELLTSSRLNNSNNSFTDSEIEAGEEYTYWVTFVPKSYGDITAPIESKLSCSCELKHDDSFIFTHVNAELNDGENGGILLSWTPEREGNDVEFFIQRWSDELGRWENLNQSGQTTTTYIDNNVSSWKEYKYRIKTSYWGMDFYSEEKTICYAVMTKVNGISASQGTYSNMVKINWNVTVLSEGDTRYVVSRKLLGDPHAVFHKIYEVTDNESVFYYEDISAQPGQFYNYKVTAFAQVSATGTEESKWVEGNSKETDGFALNRGLVTGRIKYGTGTAVKGAEVLLEKSDDNDNDSKQFYSLYLESEGEKCFEWKPSDEVIRNYLSGDDAAWTIQLYARPESGMNGMQTLFDVNGHAGVDVMPVTDGYELYVKSTAGSDAATSSATGIIVPADLYSHIVFSFDGENTYKIRAIAPDTEIRFVEGGTMKTFAGKSAAGFGDEGSSGVIGFGIGGFGGYIDEVRVWSKELSDDEIISNYDRILASTEADLLCYWPMDEGVSGLKFVYDYSKNNGVPNGNHASIKNDALVSEVVPAPEQLSLYGVTDVNGNYVIRGVPFSGDGTAYIVRPVMGIHEFSPSYHTRYISNNTLTHNDVSFEDVSSFPVSGVIYYENTTYPVKGCKFFVDGEPCTKEGKLIESDESGRFEISVPIGEHYITVEKNGHTFTDEGRYPAGTGTRYNFEKPMSNLTFYNNTLVHVAGRVVGGDIEGKKVLGFGKSVNNIGTAQLVLTPTNDIYSLNVVKKVDGTVISYENNSEELECKTVTGNINSRSWRGTGDDAGKIFINTDARTGEFSAMVPPIVYNVSAPVIISTKQSVGSAGLVDVTNTIDIKSDTLVHENGEKTFFKYNSKYNCIYHSEPDFTVTQVGSLYGEFGITKHTAYDETGEFTVDIVNSDGTYQYGVPFFIQDDPYTFKLKGFEQYTNHDSGSEVTTTVPLENCIVTISNALSDGQPVLLKVEASSDEDVKVGDVVNLKSNQLKLDKKGEATYKWKAGMANITPPYSRTITITYEIGGQVNTWKPYGKESMEGIILGSLPTGSNFVTMGPDKLLMVLRDPPGSFSSAEWTKGTVTSYEKFQGENSYLNGGFKSTVKFGGDVTLVAGVGVAYVQHTSASDDAYENIETISEKEDSRTVSHSITVTEAISTSDDNDMVGSVADLFIGQSTNMVFGKAREVGFTRDTGGNVNLGVHDIISTGTQFSTNFAYTAFYIDYYLIPNLRTLRNRLLIPLSEADYNNYQNNSDELKFITKLTPDDPKFGSDNSDKSLWGADAVKQGSLEGPSYKIVLPQRLLEERSFGIGETHMVDQDSIYFYNLQINNWLGHLATNEKEKVDAWNNREERLLKNYSFDSGAKVNYTYEADSTVVTSYKSTSGLNAVLGNITGFEIGGIGWEVEITAECNNSTTKSEEESNTGTATFSFTLADDDVDALSVDVYKSPYSYIFRTRAGQTSAPYEDEEYTQYYQPGKHKLHEATMQIEVPEIDVEVATVTNLAAGSAASFTLLLTNKSEIDYDIYYNLLMIEESNPNGAQLSIDGVALADKRVIKVPTGETIKKTLLLKQSNIGILDYENIGLVLASQRQGDPTNIFPQIADTVYISAHYVPSSSPVKMELNRTLLNTSSGADLDITFNSFDRNYHNLKAFRIQYMKQGDTGWTLLKEYLANVSEGQQLTSMQLPLPETANVTYSLDMSSFADGKYKFRILSASTYGTGESTLVTDAVEVIKDMARPMVFGTPKPSTGFLGAGEEIGLTFNEDINSGRLTSTGNFLVTAVLNGDAVAHNIALKASGSDDAVAKTDAGINLAGRSFAADMWVKINGEGTIFSHGNATNKFTVGIKEIDGQYFLAVDGEACSYPGKPLPQDKWIYLAFNLDQENADASYFTALYANDATSEYVADGISVERHEGNGVVALGDGFTGAIHEVTLWDDAISVTNLQAQMHETKRPTTEHLIGYWKFNEGLGTEARDFARNRHMKLGSTSWYRNNVNMSLNLVDGLYGEDDAYIINMSESSVLNGDDFMIEMWFRAEPQQDSETAYLFDCDAMSVTLENGRMKLYAKASAAMSDESRHIMSMGNESYNDGKWHHLAINVLRNGNTIAYIDGEAAGQVASANVPALQTAWIHLGAQCYRTGSDGLDVMQNKLKGEIDEIRIWNATLNASVIRDRMNQRLKGNEPGLIAYYPFEEEKLDANSQVVTEASALDMVTRRHSVTARRTGTSGITCTNEAPALKPAANATNLNYSFVASERGIVIELGDDTDRLEGVTVNITVKDVLDLNGNKSLPVTWTALVKRNQLIWVNENIEVEGLIGEPRMFTATISNKSARTEQWVLSDLPSWLSADHISGTLPALGNQEIVFTADASAPAGKSEFTVYMSGNSSILAPLTINMNLKAEMPQWSVEPSDYEGSATLFSAVKINVDGKILFSEDEDDLVAAFIDGECRGLANVQYDSFSDSYHVYLYIHGHAEDAGKSIKLEVWDASTGFVHPVVTAFDDINADVQSDAGYALTYQENMTWGNYDQTYLVYATDYIQQSTPLKKNWNWISVYVSNRENGNAINSVLESINPNGIIIKNASAFSEYVTSFNEWENSDNDESNISAVTSESMYKLKMNAADTLVVTGEQAAGTSIAIAKGWNWIPYTRSFDISIDDALASASPSRNDVIKSQDEYAMYNGTAWYGTLKSLKPGRGYLYKSSSASGGTISYPTKRSSSASFAPALRVEERSMFTPVDPTLYESNMTLLAVVDEENGAIDGAQEIAVFDGAVCLAKASLQEDGFFYLTIPGDRTLTSRLVVYAVADGEITETSTSLYFAEDATLGDYDNPFKITAGEATSIDKLIAQGNYSRMQVADLSGRIYYSGTPEEFDGNRLLDGQYIFEFITAEGETVCYKQLIRRFAE